MITPTNETANTAEPDDFHVAANAVTRAIRQINADQRGGDGAEFITHLLATVAANLGSSEAVTAGRPGSWEAAGVEGLLHSIVGYNDEYLLTYRTEPVEIVVNGVYEFDDLGMFETYEASTSHIGQVLFGDRWTPSRDRLSLDQLEQIEDIEELLVELEKRDRAEYQQRFTATIHTRFEQLRTEDPHRYPENLTITVRFTADNASNDDLTDGWGSDLASLLYQHARETTPLPGTDTAPDWTAGQRHADTVLAAGHWPHLRIPTLAHYGVPTNTRKD
ncbi:hypothetical protein EV646_112164 [Kribbella antiqua]|uniref:Uncharacterized protein n=1 Tax=Kribbella antiqua TaxID=2512217 RepID=A0A4R2IGP3_9ACTN|nr:hypothetical protein [Kribbella antiqua]TCO43587.1 hypothetical protein EV646_112164 [Kribbella antiqua]